MFWLVEGVSDVWGRLRLSFERKRNSVVTRELYEFCLRDLFGFLGVSPELFLGDPVRYVQMWVDGHLDRSPSRVVLTVSACKRFCRANGVRVDWDVLELPRLVSVYEDRVPTLGEIRRLLEVVGLRERAMILLMCSAGLRIGALSWLRFKDFTVLKGCVRLKVVSKGKRYETYCTLEAWEAVGKYREFRERYGEEVSPDSWVLRDGFDTTDPEGARSPRQMSAKSYRSLMSKMFRKAGLRKEYKVRHEIHSHSLRKWFKTTLELAGVPSLIVEILMGHDVGLHSNYMRVMRPGTPSLEQYYLKAVPYLTISEVEEVKREAESKVAVERSRREDLERVLFKLRSDVDELKRRQGL